MRHALVLLAVVSFGMGHPAFAETTRFSSGLIKTLTQETGARTSREIAEANFFKTEFGSLSKKHAWKKLNTITDKTHAHSWYQMEVDGIPILDGLVKTHFNRKGYLQYSTSALEEAVTLPLLDQERRNNLVFECHTALKKRMDGLYGNYEGKITPHLVILQRDGASRYACNTFVVWPRKGVYRQFIVETEHFEILEERRLVRTLDVAAKAYLSSPIAKSAGTFDNVTLTDLDVVTKLTNSLLDVKREELDNDTDPVLQDVDPQVDYTAVMGFNEAPAMDDGLDCEGSCPNQSFDAVNVYFHLNSYRRQLDANFATLGLGSTVSSALNDPLQVIVNAMSVDITGDGDTTNDTNNAAYIPVTCREGVTGGPEFDRCLIFLRPEPILTSLCTGSVASIEFFHLAREANVIVHEYQHYITDSLTGMVPGTIAKANVGDALHEGYSDYFGASEVMRISGNTTGEIIGESSFRNCSVIIRDVSDLRVYANDADDEDPHISGLSWASGLWRLRDTLGAGATDLLALKSLFFLSTRPGFIEAVEALVLADQALNAGANVGTIRSLFYDEIKFVGGQSGVFRDPAAGVAELGLRSCLGTAGSAVNPGAWLFVTLLWLVTTIAVGRRW